jgi:hypothetical protein
MAAKPVVDGLDKQLAGRVRIVRMDVATREGKKVALKVGLDTVPTFIAYGKDGLERWRTARMPSKPELWRRLVAL